MEITDLIYKYLSQEKSVNTEIIKKKAKLSQKVQVLKKDLLFLRIGLNLVIGKETQ